MSQISIEDVVAFLASAGAQERDIVANAIAAKPKIDESLVVDCLKEHVSSLIEDVNTHVDKKDALTTPERFSLFLASESKHGIIWAPTQVGKSAAMLSFIETCFENNTPVIVSTDNKSDQCEQLFDRIQNGLCGTEIKLLKVCDQNFQKSLRETVKSGSQRYVVFCMNNATQINKLLEGLIVVGCGPEKEHFELSNQIALVHDEADTITKDSNTEVVNDAQAASHKAWIELVIFFQTRLPVVPLKRMFVTATPENCCLLYAIDCADVIRLDIPNNYVGYKSIEYERITDELQIRHILLREVNRIKDGQTNEVILYCIDRKIDGGQDLVLQSLANTLDCTVNTYNGNGLVTIFNTQEQRNAFESLARADGIAYSINRDQFHIKRMSIRRFYTICKKIGEKCVVTIGKDLIARGISYVGEDKVAPLTATTMVYKPGTSMHAVGIAQAVGRITGCAVPELKRRLYAPDDVIKTYVAYSKNQELYIEKIEAANQRQYVKEIIGSMMFDKYKRCVDRRKLGIKMNMAKRHQGHTEINKIIRNWTGKQVSILGGIFTHVSNHPQGVDRDTILRLAAKLGSSSPEELCVHLTNKTKHYNEVYEWRHGCLFLTQAARQCLSSMASEQ